MLTTIILAGAVAVAPANKSTLRASVSIAESCRIERTTKEPSIYCNGKTPVRVVHEPAQIQVEELGVIEGKRMVVVF